MSVLANAIRQHIGDPANGTCPAERAVLAALDVCEQIRPQSADVAHRLEVAICHAMKPSFPLHDIDEIRALLFPAASE